MLNFDPTKPYSLRNGRKCEVHKLAEVIAMPGENIQIGLGIGSILATKKWIARRDALLNQESGK